MELVSSTTDASGTFTIPADGYYNLEIHGGGGCGGNWYSQWFTSYPGGAGGGSGAYIDNVHLTAGSYSYSVGAGGTTLTAGSPSVFGNYTVNGGGAGETSRGSAPSGGAFGAYTDGMTNMATAGGGGNYNAGLYRSPGQGNSCFGATYGNGGSGGYTTVSGNVNVGHSPGVGYAGAIIIESASGEQLAGLYNASEKLADWNSLGLIMDNPNNTETNRNALSKYGNDTKLVLPRNRVATIGRYAFSSCTTLSEVEISQGTRIIDRYAFYSCTNLKQITIPNSVTEIRTYSLSNLASNCKIIFNGTYAQWETIAKETYWLGGTNIKLQCVDYSGYVYDG